MPNRRMACPFSGRACCTVSCLCCLLSRLWYHGLLHTGIFFVRRRTRRNVHIRRMHGASSSITFSVLTSRSLSIFHWLLFLAFCNFPLFFLMPRAFRILARAPARECARARALDGREIFLPRVSRLGVSRARAEVETRRHVRATDQWRFERRRASGRGPPHCAPRANARARGAGRGTKRRERSLARASETAR